MRPNGAALLLLLAAAAAAPSPAAAFAPPGSGALAAASAVRSRSAAAAAAPASKPLYMGQIPILDDWRVLRSGAVVGTVSNHPTIEDGDVVTTSPLADPDSSGDGVVVVTESGSKYRLGAGAGSSARGRRNGARAPGGAAAAAAARVAAPAKRAAAKKPEAKRPPVAAAAKKSPPAKKAAPAARGGATAADPGTDLQDRLRRAKIQYGLTGQTVGGGRYLLAGKARRTTSGKSQIFAAYKSDPDGLPTGSALTVKLSPNVDAIERESRNYDRVRGGLFSGRFVRKIEFLPRADGPGFDKQCALVIETGKKDLKAVLAQRMNRGLTGRAMRNAASAAAQCVQAMHTSGLVWTDLKAENFVVLPDSVDMAGMAGIDLESAVPVGGNPIDYSPEACPPEFADAFLSGKGTDFVVDYSYDVWSYGMLLYELSTGRPYFSGKSPSAITKALRFTSFEARLDAVEDGRLRDLIGQCLQRDPKKRPGVTQILLHPYFVTSGIGPFSF